MTALTKAVSTFVAAEVGSWPGLPSGVRLSDLPGLLDLDPEDQRRGDAGEPPRTRLWVPAAVSEPGRPAVYHGGIRVWLAEDDPGAVVLWEGLNPLDVAGEPLAAPDLGAPDAVLEAVLGPFHVPDGERVYAARGLALQVAPETGVLVAVLAFAPTDLGDYRRRLRPHREPTRPLPRAATR